jgi:serine/threonine protein kinase
MVMEFVPGRSLEAKLKERQAQGQPFTPVEAVPIVEELASAIDYAHNQGVIHHDLKPNNILFTADGQIVLTDFGIARIVALPNYTVPGLVLGTPAYMAPEQARGQRGDPRSDVFSMGVLLYEMMTGRVPLKARTPWEMVMKYTNEQPPPPASINPAISPAVERVILKALSQSPDKRYQTARGLARALAKAVRLPQPPPPISSPSSPAFSYDVFISYSPADRLWVQQELWPWLEQAGLRVCIDLRDFQPGAPRPTEVERAVLTSRKTLLILTPGYLESEWDEFGNLMLQTLDPAGRQRRLIPLRKEKCDLPVRLSYLWPVDFVAPANQDLAWTQLLTALNAPLT